MLLVRRCATQATFVAAELPGVTQFVVDLSGFIVKYGIYCVVGVVVVVLAR